MLLVDQKLQQALEYAKQALHFEWKAWEVDSDTYACRVCAEACKRASTRLLGEAAIRQIRIDEGDLVIS